MAASWRQHLKIVVLVSRFNHIAAYRPQFARFAMPRGGQDLDRSTFFKSANICFEIRILMQTISLRLPDDLLAQLASEAKTTHVTKSWLVRECLKKAIYKQPPAGAVSCYDLARNLAGILKGLPEDLADDPQYVEGFGQ
jgi:hypothetical protein